MDIPPYALEDDLLDGLDADGEPHTRVYTLPQPVVVLGRGSKPAVELHLDACLADGVPLLRRRGGGCAVVLDPGNVIVATARPAAGIGGNQAHFDRLTDWLVEALAALGHPGVRKRGISDLALGDRKVGGSCIYRRKGALLFSASLLVHPDLDAVERYLAHPPREPDYRRGRGHREFIGRLVDGETSVLELAGRLQRALVDP